MEGASRTQKQSGASVAVAIAVAQLSGCVMVAFTAKGGGREDESENGLSSGARLLQPAQGYRALPGERHR